MSSKRHPTSECVFFRKQPCACGRTFGEYLQERIDSGVERKAYDEQVAQRERERVAFAALLDAEGDEQG